MGRWQINYHVACEIQRKLLAAMDKKDTTPSQLASLATSWERIEERKRILRNKPLVKAVEAREKSKTPTLATFTE